MIGWTTLAGPKGPNPAVSEKIRADVQKALGEPDIAQRYATFGYGPFPTMKEQFGAYIASESSRFADVVEKAGITLDRASGPRPARDSNGAAAFDRGPHVRVSCGPSVDYGFTQVKDAAALTSPDPL